VLDQLTLVQSVTAVSNIGWPCYNFVSICHWAMPLDGRRL